MPQGDVLHSRRGLMYRTGGHRGSWRKREPRHPRAMVTVAALVNGIGGMAQKRQLVALGVRDLDLTLAVKRATVLRARQGWYTTLPADSAAVLAVRVGGRLTGLSLVAELGGWVLSQPPLHVSVPVNAARLRSATNRFVHPGATSIRGVKLHWEPCDLAGRGTATAVDLLDALMRVVLDEDLETAVAALDWAMYTNRIDLIDFERMLQQLPASLCRRAWRARGCGSRDTASILRFVCVGSRPSTSLSTM